MKYNSLNVYKHFFNLQVILLNLLILAKINAQGGPPMVTDDPYPVEKGHWEINVGLIGEFTGESQLYQSPLVDCNYGINKRMHIKFETPFEIHRELSVTESGIGKSSIGIKWLLYNDPESEYGLGIFPAFSFNIFNSSAENGISEKGVEFFLPFSVMKTLGKYNAVFQAGRVFRSAGKGEWHYGLLLSASFLEHLEAAAELTGNLQPDFTGHQSFFNAGFRYNLGKVITLLISGGRQLITKDGNEKASLIFTGIRIFI